MEKINYQREADRIIAALTEKGQRERLLLHACCGPCASYVLEYLSAYFDITVLRRCAGFAPPHRFAAGWKLWTIR